MDRIDLCRPEKDEYGKATDANPSGLLAQIIIG